MNELLLSCDWGTSNFRLRLVDLNTKEIRAEVLSDTGISSAHLTWKTSQLQKTVTKADFYTKLLEDYLSQLSAKSQTDIRNIPLVISGMASSTLGIFSLPYASIPFDISGKDLVIKTLILNSNFVHDVFLISGISDNKDVLRGEETELIGVFEWLKRQSISLKKIAAFIFPGTHSKHIFLEEEEIRGFSTYITGELFMLMNSKSILKESVSPPDTFHQLAEEDLQAFSEGVKLSQTSGLLKNLFTVRSNRLFDVFDKTRNYFFLSGLLIGSELIELKSSCVDEVVLCSGRNVYDFYRVALEKLQIQAKLIPAAVMDTVAVEGHLRVFKDVIIGNKQYEKNG